MKILFSPFLLLSLLLVLISADTNFSQDTTQSLAFKNNRPVRTNPYFYRPNLSYQILQQFRLIQEANAGDPLAQHELGLRLLNGEGVAADTTEAVKWIKRAAEQNLSAAAYNYGILLINGLGTDWNPFSAFLNFKKAAIKGMAQAQYVVGILYTDNLIVKRDWEKAYYWIKQSEMNGYSVSEDIVSDLGTRVPETFKDSVDNGKITLRKEITETDNKETVLSENNTSVEESIGLVFIDFENVQDTLENVPIKTLINDLTHLGIDNILDSLKITINAELDSINQSFQIVLINSLAEFGSPEALTLLGKMREDGKYFKKDLIKAIVYYIRAIRLDSPRAPFLLWKLINNSDVLLKTNELALKNDPDAMFAWYGLAQFGYNNEIIMQDAFNLLMKASQLNHLPSILELGVDFYTGNFLEADQQKAFELWKFAESLGSNEAKVRILISKILDNKNANTTFSEIKSLIEFSEKGSVLSQAALGFCYENGVGTVKHKGTAVKYYRLAAQRGNQFAYEQLLRLYNELRPSAPEFEIANK